MAITYRTLLQNEFQQRLNKNPSYSLRAFARDLGIPVSNLSDVLRKKRGLSTESASKMVEVLKMGSDEGRYFVALVQKEHGRSVSVRNEAKRRIKSLESIQGFNEISLEKFSIVSNWVHFALLELSHVDGFDGSPKWMADRLGVSQGEIEEAIERLLKLGLLKRDVHGALKDAEIDLATGNDVPSKYIREHHRQILEKAGQTLEVVPVEEREYSVTMMAIDESKLSEAKAALREFRKKFCKNVQRSKKKNRVYCFSTQFFPLDRSNQGGGLILQEKLR